MCLFITAVIPRSAESPRFSELVKQHRFAFSPCENAHVLRQLRDTERYVYATQTYCDCGSPLFFRSAASKPRSQQQLDQELRKLRRKKWSEAKIARWIEATGPRPVDPNAPPNGQRSVRQWADFLTVALALPGVGYVGIVGHTYSGDLETEAFTLASRVQHSVEALRAGALGVLDEDVVHEFRS